MRRIWNVPQIIDAPLDAHFDDRAAMLLFSRAAWEKVHDDLRINVRTSAEVLNATESHWDTIASDLEGDVVYSIGGGLATDAAKYIAAKRELSLVCVPTAMTVDAFFTWASGVRRDGCITYIETKPPDIVLIDYNVLRNAPAELRASGICDVLSIATGTADWLYAESLGKNNAATSYIPTVAETANSILRGAIDAAEAAGRGDREGLMRLVEALVLEVQLCNLIGHSRPEEGSEHYFAYCAESLLHAGMAHGELVGPGILTIARIQGVDAAPLERALKACCVPLDRIPAAVAQQTLQQLPKYCRQFNLPHGVAHDLSGGSLT